MPTNQQIYDKLQSIEALLMQLINALNDDSDAPQYDFDGNAMSSNRPGNQEL